MAYTKDQIVKDVKMLIDENEDNERLIDEDDEVANDTEKLIESVVVQSIDQINLMAPLWRVAKILTSVNVELTDKKTGNIPSDFLRYAYTKASDWSQPVFDPIDQDSDEYKMQSSKFAGIRGSAEKPVVAIVPNKLIESGLGLEVYSTKEDKVTLAYVKKATEASIIVSDLCYPALLNLVAKYYMVNVGNTDRAKYYDAMAAELLGISTNTNSE